MAIKNFVVKNGITTGNVTINAATGNITGLGNANLGNLALANFFSGDGGLLSNISGANVTGNISGNISNANFASYAGNVTGATQSNITAVGTLANLSVSGNAAVGGLLTNNLYYANGIAWDFQLPGGSNTQIQFNDNGSFGASANFTFDTTTNILSVNGNVAAANIISGGIISSTGTVTGGNLATAGTLSVGGNANVGNLGTVIITATGNITGANLVTGGIVTATGTITGGNLATAGTLSAGGNANVGNIGATNGIFTTVSASGNANVGNIGANNAVFTGAGSFGANLNMASNWINNVGYPALSTDAATKSYVDTMVSSGIAYHPPVLVATTTTLATATGGTTSYNSPNGAANGIGAYISTTGTFANIDGISVTTLGTRILVKDEANSTWNGVYTYANSTAIVRSTDTDEYGPDSTEQLSINDYFFVQSGDINEGSSYIVSAPAGTITFGTSNITFAQFSTSQVYNAGTGLTLTNTTFSVNNSQSQITAIGTLSSLSVSGNANIGNIETGGVVTASGNVTGANITTGGVVTASGNVTGANLVTGGIITATGTITGGNLATAGTLSAGGNANVGNLGVTNIIATGSANVGQINVTGNIIPTANVTYDLGNNTNRFKDLWLSGTTIQIGPQNIQSNSTSIILSGDTYLPALSVSGNANVGNIGTGGLITAVGNITGGNLVTGGIISVTGNANVGNIGTTGVFASTLSSTGNATVGNLDTGGLITATGNITGANLVTGGIITATGTITGGNLATAGTLSAGGNANVGNLGVTGVFASTLSSTGNANIGNIGTGGLITAIGNVAGGNITTGGIVSASGNVVGGNLVTSGFASVTGNVNAGNVNSLVGFGTSRSNVAVTTNTVIDQFNPATFRTAKYVISASGDNGYQSVETLLVQDGANSYITIYGSICSNNSADIIELTSDINGITGNVSVYATASGTNTYVNLVASYIKT